MKARARFWAGCGLAVALGIAAAWPPTAGAQTAPATLGKAGRPLQQFRCPKMLPTCLVTVVVERNNGSANTCGIDVVDVVLAARATERIVFALKNGGTGPSGAQYAFRPGGAGIVVAENNDDATDLSEPAANNPAGSGSPVFVREAASTPTQERLAIQRRLDKAFAYTVQLDRTPAGGGAGAPCPPLDPVIVTRGD